MGCLRNLVRTAAHDPVWAISALILSPVRAVRQLLGIVVTVLAVAFVLALRDCQEFRVGAAIVDLTEAPDGTTQSFPHS